MPRRSLLMLIALFFLFAPLVASAGLILDDGKEWEVRGLRGTWSDHTAWAAADTGWTWATESEWLATGLDNVTLFDPDWSALIGVGDGVADNPDAYFADTPESTATGNIAKYALAADLGTATSGYLDAALIADQTNIYRLSYREAQVPSAPTLALVCLSLIMLAWFRSKRLL